MRLPLVVFLFCILPRLGAQQLIFENLSRLNLPSQEAYNVMQDRKGYIWIGTEGGLCRYNGNSLKVFDRRNGLPENSCFVVKEDPLGRLWLVTAAARILLCENDSLKEMSFSKTFAAQFKNTTDMCYRLDFKNDSFFINTKNYIYTGSWRSGYFKRTGDTSSTAHFSFIKTKDQLLYFPAYNITSAWYKSITAQTNKGYANIKIISENKTTTFNAPFLKNRTNTWRVYMTINKKGEWFIAYDHTLIKLYPDLSYEFHMLSSAVLCLYTDRSEGLWVGTLKRGFDYYPHTDDMKYHITGLSDYSITGICEDHEKGIWCTSLEKGVFYCRSKCVTSYANIPDLGQKADLLKTIHDTVYTTSNLERIYRLHDQAVSQRPLHHTDNHYALSDIISYKGGFILTTGDQTVYTNRDFKPQFYLKNNSDLSGKILHSGNKGLAVSGNKVFTMSSQGLGVIRENKVNQLLKFSAPATCICNSKDGISLYIGTKNGAYCVDTRDTKILKVKQVPDDVIKITEDHLHRIWFLIRQSGLYMHNGKRIIDIGREVKLPGTFYFDMVEDRFHVLWLASNVGVIKLWQEKNSWKIHVYNTLNGLASSQTYKLTADSNRLYVSTAEGINSFLLRQDLSDISKPAIYLRSLEVNNHFELNSEPLDLAYDHNSLKLQFDVLTFKAETSSLIYTLKNGGKKYYHARGTDINLNNLLPGKYELSVYPAYNTTILNSSPFVLHFSIRPAFWQQPWFIVLSVLFVLGLLVFIVKKIIRRVKRKEQEKATLNIVMAEYQLTALQAQMNPHFIFNVINSIQTYVLDNDVQAAYDYLAKFSKLVRMVLDNAREKMISLEKELEVLGIYIQLEQLRFGNHFTYNLLLDESIDRESVYLPPMLLQPFVENAIWHGLMPLKKSKQALLTIRIQVDPAYIKMSVEDNGIGRRRSATLKTLSHQSAGLDLSQQRLRVLHSLPGYTGVNIVIIDLHDQNGEPSGTQVHITLPLISSDNDY